MDGSTTIDNSALKFYEWINSPTTNAADVNLYFKYNTVWADSDTEEQLEHSNKSRKWWQKRKTLRRRKNRNA